MGSPSPESLLGKCLLEYGEPPDVTITCIDPDHKETRSWKLHKAVLGEKSSFFRMNPAGMTQHAENDAYNIHTGGFEVVEQSLTWIYAGKLDDPVFDDHTAHDAYTELFSIAEILAIHDLSKYCIAQLETRLKKRAIEIQRRFHEGGENENKVEDSFSDDELRGILQGIKSSHLKPLQQLWVDFIEATLYLILRINKFTNAILLSSILVSGPFASVAEKIRFVETMAIMYYDRMMKVKHINCVTSVVTKRTQSHSDNSEGSRSMLEYLES
ncbi:hypothetical protein F5Y06DRAFT_300509 [Hypoxylon sp. FL0890]|nr:hypothetical protein F5Y06DRAFT_300509 [Hypoxylon sp. FL0890]